MGNSPSKSTRGEEPVKTTLFEREPDGITYRIPALIYLRHSHTFLAFAEKRSSPSDCDAKHLVMRRGTLKDDGSVQVVTFCSSCCNTAPINAEKRRSAVFLIDLFCLEKFLSVVYEPGAVRGVSPQPPIYESLSCV